MSHDDPHDPHDPDLSSHFAALRAADAAHTPPFADLCPRALSLPPRRRLMFPILTLVTAAAALIAIAFILTRPNTPPAPEIASANPILSPTPEPDSLPWRTQVLLTNSTWQPTRSLLASADVAIPTLFP